MTGTGQNPLLVVLTTGGTIASSLDSDGAARPNLGAAELLSLLPPMAVDLRAQEVLAKDSASLTLADMQRISDAVGAALADPQITGVIALHGTDAMEETALLVQLQHGPQKPVIFTGAQFASDHPRSDGARNFTDAVRAALQPQADPGSLWPLAVRSCRFGGFTNSRPMHPTPFGGWRMKGQPSRTPCPPLSAI
ncbi:asparaginase domain-containing protein [Paracoccus kondratievae]